MLLRQLHPLDRGRGGVAHRVGGLDRLHPAADRGGPQPVDGAVAGDRHQPRDRARPGRVEGGGLAPHRHVDVLKHVLGLASVVQDTQADAEKLRGGILVDDAQGARGRRPPRAQGRRQAGCGLRLRPSSLLSREMSHIRAAVIRRRLRCTSGAATSRMTRLSCRRIAERLIATRAAARVRMTRKKRPASGTPGARSFDLTDADQAALRLPAACLPRSVTTS